MEHISFYCICVIHSLAHAIDELKIIREINRKPSQFSNGIECMNALKPSCGWFCISGMVEV